MCQPNSTKDEIVKMSEEEDIATSPIAKNWVGLYRSMPTINFPFTSLNVSFSLCSAAVLYTVRLTVQFVLVSVLEWPKGEPGTHEAVGSLAAIFHSINLVAGLAVALTTQPFRPTDHISTAPQWWQDLVDALLQFCTGYMIYDSVTSFFMVKGLNLEGSDYMFLGHHLATIIYMTQTRVLKAGHTSAMICMFLGELSNPFHNGNIALSHALLLPCCNGPLMQQVDYVNEFLFALTYFGIRAIIAPFVFLHVTWQILFAESRTNIPFVTRIFWIFLIWAVEGGSYAWIVASWRTLQTYMGATSVGTNEL